MKDSPGNRAGLKRAQPVSYASDASRYIRAALRAHLDLQEAFAVLLLDAQHTVIGNAFVVALGTAHSVEVHPRDVFREAVRRNACAVIVGHNHPSGNTEPSHEDKALTQRLVDAGKLLGIQLLDHVIVTTTNYYSFAEGDLL